MKIYKNTTITNEMKQEFDPENEYEQESSAMMETVLFVYVKNAELSNT